MKRKLIAKLMQSAGATAAEKLLLSVLADATENAQEARIVLSSSIIAARRDAVDNIERFYDRTCNTTPEQLLLQLGGTPAGAFSVEAIGRAQAAVRSALTSRAGRPRGNVGSSRTEQVAAAQVRRRDKLANVEGRKRITEWISAEMARYLLDIKQAYDCGSRAEALEMVLQAAAKNNLLPLPDGKLEPLMARRP